MNNLAKLGEKAISALIYGLIKEIEFSDDSYGDKISSINIETSKGKFITEEDMCTSGGRVVFREYSLVLNIAYAKVMLGETFIYSEELWNDNAREFVLNEIKRELNEGCYFHSEIEKKVFIEKTKKVFSVLELNDTVFEQIFLKGIELANNRCTHLPIL